MRLRGVTEDQLTEIIERVNAFHETCIYANFNPKRGRFISFTLRLSNSRAPFHRLGASDARRMVAVCWHGHREVMDKLFFVYPHATLISIFARYNGREEFLAEHPSTAWRNMGSSIEPIDHEILCECLHTQAELKLSLAILRVPGLATRMLSHEAETQHASPSCSRCEAKELKNFFTGKSKRIVCPKCMSELEALGVAQQKEEDK